MRKIECYTLFDITATGINGHVKAAQFPYQSKFGITINDHAGLLKARNQQRNFDTLLQLIGLRTQVYNISQPTQMLSGPFGARKTWHFTFEIEPQSQWTVDGDDLWILKQDSEGTPMIVNLDEEASIDPKIFTQGNKVNTVYHA